jgi:hypothetical protein
MVARLSGDAVDGGTTNRQRSSGQPQKKPYYPDCTKRDCNMNSPQGIDDILPAEKIAFIAYNIGVYESVQKFGSLITSGKITGATDAEKVAELLAETTAFYDSEMISQLVNSMIRSRGAAGETSNTIGSVTAANVEYVMKQLKVAGVSLGR